MGTTLEQDVAQLKKDVAALKSEKTQADKTGADQKTQENKALTDLSARVAKLENLVGAPPQ